MKYHLIFISLSLISQFLPSLALQTSNPLFKEQICLNDKPPLSSLLLSQNSSCLTESSHELSNIGHNATVQKPSQWDAPLQLVEECQIQKAGELEYCVLTSNDVLILSTPSIAAQIALSASSIDTSSPVQKHTEKKEKIVKRGDLVRTENIAMVIDVEILSHLDQRGMKEAGQGQDFIAAINERGFRADISKRPHWVVLEGPRPPHDCRPNSRYGFDPTTLTYRIHALDNLSPNEIPTVSYNSPLTPSNLRAPCNCPLCTSPPSQLQLSDTRLAAISALRAELEDYTPFLSRKSPATIDQALELIVLCEEEKLWSLRSEVLGLAAVRFCMWKDAPGAREYATKALEYWIEWETSRGAEEKRKLEILRDDPMASWCWGLAGLERDDPYYG